MIGGMDIHVGADMAHARCPARDDRLTVFFDGSELFVAIDRRVPGPPGKVGLWTRADSMAIFESLEIKSID
jgi:hypothetical protein